MKKNLTLKYGSNFISSILSIGFVIFLIGLIGSIILHADQISKHVKENIVVNIMMKEKAKDADILGIQKNLDANPIVHSTSFITSEQAAEIFIRETGENFIEFLGYIPIPPSIQVHLKAEHARSEVIEKLKAQLIQNPYVKDVFYEKDLVEVLNDNIARITIILGSIAILLLLISIVLINNTLRLHIYSKRFLIRSMLLIGAPHRYISKPFLTRGFWIGLLGSFFAIFLVISAMSFFQQQIPDLKNVFVLKDFTCLLAFMAIVGITISLLSSLLAVRRYIRLNIDTLHK